MKGGIIRFSFLIVSLLPGPVLGQVIIPVQINEGLAFVPVNIQGVTLSFLIDSGSEACSIDSQTASTLQMPVVGQEKVQKNFREIIADIVEIRKLSIGPVTFEHIKCDELSLSSISAALGVKIDGVLGNDVLSQIVFQLSFTKKHMVIGPVLTKKSAGNVVILKRDHGQFLVPVILVRTPVDLVLDTGTNLTNLSWSTWDKLTSSWKPGEVIEGIMRAGKPTSPAILVCLPEIRLGSVITRNNAVRAQTRSNQGVFAEEYFGGVLGADILRQFEPTFDLRHDRIFLKRDSAFERDPYRFTTIGIQIAKNDLGIYEIMSVWKDSPAAQSGLQDQDLLVEIDGKKIQELDLQDVIKMLHAKEGTVIELTIERNGNRSMVTVRTRKLLCT